MIPRPSRIWAITKRELRSDLKGRKGLSVPGLLVALLLPASMLPDANPLQAITMVSGDVPESVRLLPDVEVADRHDAMRFTRTEAGLTLIGADLTTPIREALDAELPAGATTIDRRQPQSQLPRRGLLLAILAASGLTASIAASIGTERSRKTLTTLLSAAITPHELVLGKWLAWSGLATVTTLTFAGVALLRGVMNPGWWLLPMAITPAATVALGLWSVRDSPDVVSATSTALRVMPAATMITGITAASLGDGPSWLGALVPLGGALAVAGEMWLQSPGRDALIATASTLIATAALLWHTGHTLTEAPTPPTSERGWSGVPAVAVGGLLALSCPMVMPQLWSIAGNASVVADLSPDFGPLVAVATLGVAAVALFLRQTDSEPVVNLRRIGGIAAVASIAAGAGLALADPLFGGLADPATMVGALQGRFHELLAPSGMSLLAAVALMVAEEFLFRGMLAARMGHGPASAAWAIAKAPLDPIAAIVSGSVMGTVGARWGLYGALLTRITWWGALTLAG